MNQLQRKVLLFLLSMYKDEIADAHWYENEWPIPSLSAEERRWLSFMLKERGMYGEEDGEFVVNNLILLAEHWLGKEA
jgi:hypothetical protein